MTLQIEPLDVPIRIDEDGVAWVGQTRVPIDTVIEHFNEGDSPAEIVYGYPTLKLEDVYAVLAYYLQHRREIDDYMAFNAREAEKLKRQIEAEFPPHGIRERLLARRNEWTRPIWHIEWLKLVKKQTLNNKLSSLPRKGSCAAFEGLHGC